MSINCFSLFLVVGVANSFFLVSHRKYISFGSSINLATFVFPFFIVQYRLYLSKNEHVYKSINSRIRFRYKISVGTVLDWERKNAPWKRNMKSGGMISMETWFEVKWFEWREYLTTGPSAERWGARFLVLKAKVRLYSSLKLCEAVFPSLLWIWLSLGFWFEMFQKTIRVAYSLTWRGDIQLGPDPMKFRIRYILFLIVKI